eukprot:6122993-Pyramimonas_sp.AAC.1
MPSAPPRRPEGWPSWPRRHLERASAAPSARTGSATCTTRATTECRCRGPRTLPTQRCRRRR